MLTGIAADDLKALDQRLTAVEQTLGIATPKPGREPYATPVDFSGGRTAPPVHPPRGTPPPNQIRNEETKGLVEESHGEAREAREARRTPAERRDGHRQSRRR